jgi:hypothetical protein
MTPCSQAAERYPNEDSLNGGEDFQWSGQTFDRGGIEKILAEAKDV